MIRRNDTLIDEATEYARRVVAGDIIAGPHVRASCRRHLSDLENGDARGLTFNVERAQRAIQFFPDILRLSDGQFEGKPFELHESQKFIVGSLFGWTRKDGTRRFRRGYIEEAKGNGKSPMAAGIGIYGMMADGEAGAQIFSAGARKEQAAILFADAVKMVDQSPKLASRITQSGVNPVWNLSDLRTKSFFRPISREAGRKGSGPRPHMALCDEVHEYPDRNTIEMLERGFKFRLQPLLLMFTNSGSDRNSICFEEHSHAVRVAHGEVQDDTTFSYVCALDDGDDPLNDPSCWPKANPLLSTILTEDYLAGVVAQAKAIPGKLNSILRLHFCIWTDSEKAWIAREAWEACEDSAMSLEDFAGQECWTGLDLSATKDLTGVAYVFRDGVTDDGRPKFALFARGYTPGDTLAQRALADRAPYEEWVRGGFLIAPPGKIIRYDVIAADLVDFASGHDVLAVTYDRFLIKTFESALDETGATLPLVEHPQGTNQRKNNPLWMPQSINFFEELILEKRIRIEVNPALRSAVASACFWHSPAGLRRFEKQRATGRIDLAIASTMAIGAATSAPVEQPRSFQVMFLGSKAA